jgi:rRNA-processing protein FCF1
MNMIVFDTSFLMMLAEKRSYIVEEIIRLLDPVKFEVPACVVQELQMLMSSKTVKRSKNATLALRIAQSKMTKVDTSKIGSVDDKIISYARDWDDVFVATMDYELKKRLMMENLKCITLSNDKVVLC